MLKNRFIKRIEDQVQILVFLKIKGEHLEPIKLYSYRLVEIYSVLFWDTKDSEVKSREQYIGTIWLHR